MHRIMVEADDKVDGDTRVAIEYLKHNAYYESIYGKKTIVIMLVGTFYEIYGCKTLENQLEYEGSSIEEVSYICDLVIGHKNYKCYGKHLYLAGFRDIYWEKYVERLTQNNYCVVKFDQVDGNKTNRVLSEIYSPGTFFQYNQVKLSNYTICIWIEKFQKKGNTSPIYMFGFSSIDIFSGSINIFELQELSVEDKILGDEIERYLSIYNPSEILCIFRNFSDNHVSKSITKMLNSVCNMITYINENSHQTYWNSILNCEKQSYIYSTIENYYNESYHELLNEYYRNNSFAFQSLCYLLHWISSHNPYLVEKLQIPTIESHGKNVYLANNSLLQLNYITCNTNNIGESHITNNKYS